MTVQELIAKLPDGRKQQVERLRELVLANLPKGFEEGVQGEMIAYFVPHSLFPAGYHCDPKQPLGFAAIASQKNYIALHLMSFYMDNAGKSWLQDEFSKAGKKLDMGAACMRIKNVGDLPMDVLGKAISRLSVKEYISLYENSLAQRARKTAAKS